MKQVAEGIHQRRVCLGTNRKQKWPSLETLQAQRTHNAAAFNAFLLYIDTLGLYE